MLPLLAVLGLGALLSGSLGGLRRFRVRWWPAAMASIAVQLVLFNPPFDRQAWALTWGPIVWVLCLVAMLAVLVRNGISAEPGQTAFRLAAVGLALNLLVVVANGGFMPQSTEARLAARGTPLVFDAAVPQLRNVKPSGSDTRLEWLGDVIPQPAWMPTANVVSVGDMVLSLALALLVLRLLTSDAPSQVVDGLADSQ